MIQNKNYPDTKNRFEILEYKKEQRKNLLFKSIVRLNKEKMKNRVLIQLDKSILGVIKEKFVYFH